jgi:hypothetical protein
LRHGKILRFLCLGDHGIHAEEFVRYSCVEFVSDVIAGGLHFVGQHVAIGAHVFGPVEEDRPTVGDCQAYYSHV